MKTKITFFLLLASLKIFSQTSHYFPFPDSNAVWNTFTSGSNSSSSCAGPPFPNPIMTANTFSYFMNGDTLINSKAYQTLYRSGTYETYCWSGGSHNIMLINNEYQGGLRQDTTSKKVYYIDVANTEYLLYDFSLQVGDTTSSSLFSCYYVVDSIDSVLVGSSYRKRFNVSNSARSFQIIEGIGSTFGLLSENCPFELDSWLMCFSVDGQTVFPDTTASCNNYTGLKPVQPGTTVSLFPNPFSEKITVTLDNDLKSGEVTVYNSFGVEVRITNNIKGKSLSINREFMSDGVYFIKITDNGKLISNNKIILIDN